MRPVFDVVIDGGDGCSFCPFRAWEDSTNPRGGATYCNPPHDMGPARATVDHGDPPTDCPLRLHDVRVGLAEDT